MFWDVCILYTGWQGTKNKNQNKYFAVILVQVFVLILYIQIKFYKVRCKSSDNKKGFEWGRWIQEFPSRLTTLLLDI